MPASPLYSHNGTFSRLSWPVLAGVLGVHALLVAVMVMAHVPASPAITPPMMGILLSDASSSGQGQSSGAAASTARAAPSVEKTAKRPEAPVTKKTAETTEKIAAATTANGANRTASTQDTGDGTAKASDTATAGDSGTNGAIGGTGTFSLPRVDAPGAYNPKPKYPAASRRMGEEGTVALSVHVLATGDVAEVYLKKTSGYSRLDNAAMEAVKKWRYIPARRGDMPVNYWYTQAVKFSLTD